MTKALAYITMRMARDGMSLMKLIIYIIFFIIK